MLHGATSRTFLFFVSFLALLFAPVVAPCDDSPEEISTVDGDSGVNVEVFLASAYVFRGYNVFQDLSQHDRHGVFSPTLVWKIFNTGLWLGYTGYYQTNGDNLGYNIDAGLGHEQDLFLGWTYSLTQTFTLEAYFAYYFYPFTFEELTGVKNPSYLEPALGISWERSNGPRLSLNLAYYLAVQERLEDQRYFFICPSIGKVFESDRAITLSLGAEFGYKMFRDPGVVRDNMFHAQIDTGFPIEVGKWIVITPAAHLTWTFLEDARPGNQTVVWFSLDINTAI